jgi:hypothetical protein
MMNYPLPPGDASPGYDHVLRLTVYLSLPKGSGRDPITGLDWHVLGFDDADRGDRCGTAAKPGPKAAALIREMLTAEHVHAPQCGKPPTPADALLDFKTLTRTLVVIRLFGADLWRFDATALSTKARQTVPGYKGLVGYRLVDGQPVVQKSPAGCEAIAFEVDEKMPKETIGMNFHVDFLDTGFGRGLPVIIDPDSTNGGGRPPGGQG